MQLMNSPKQKTLSSIQTKSNDAIDIVYLWVDGNDPKWRAKRRAAFAALDSTASLAPFSNVEGRFRDNKELLYSLRALKRFFPDHGHVYIVTDGHAPPWLRCDESITVIDHQSLIPASNLPTFDSGNIESYIHHIPNLSERYFYCNDDVFFGKPVKIDDWFFEGGICLAWSDDQLVSDLSLQPGATSLVNACRLSNQWLSENYGQDENRITDYVHTFRTFAHGPRPMLKSLLMDLELLAPKLFQGVRATVFRQWDQPTIISDFVLRWALAHGRAQIRDYRHLYLSSGNSDLSQKLAQLTRVDIGATDYDFFCINDTTDDAFSDDQRFRAIQLALESLLPQPSQFERCADGQSDTRFADAA